MRTLSTQRTLLVLAILSLGSATIQAQDAYLQNLSMPRYIKAGVDYPLSVWARNVSAVPYTNVSVSWSLDGGAAHTMTAITVGGGGIVTNNYLPVTCPLPLNTTQGAHTLVVTVNIPSDVNMANNSLTVDFTALTSWVDKVVLMEGRTETWCQYCPAANEITNALALEPDFAIAKFHTSDGFSFADATSYYNTQYNPTFTPAAVLDMGEYGDYTVNSSSPSWTSEMTARAAGVSPVSLTMTSNLNVSTRLLTVTLHANFTYAMTGPFKFNAYVLEDAVPGPQTNAPPNYIHNHVMRAMLGGSNGTSGIIPNAPVVGTAYTNTYTYTVPAGFKLADLQLIGMVSRDLGINDRYCLNAVKSAASPVGINELHNADADLQVYPNPFNDALNIGFNGTSGMAHVELMTLDGRVMMVRDMMLQQGSTVRLDLESGLPASLYLLRVTTATEVAQQRLMRVQ